MVKIFNGKQKSKELVNIIKKRVDKLPVKPSLLIIRTGNNQSQLKFTEIKKITAERLGITCEIIEYDRNITTAGLKDLISKNSNRYTGILVQLPLPKQIERKEILDEIPYKKDLEGLSTKRFNESYSEVYSPVAKAIVETLMEELRIKNLELRNINITVVGNGYLIGQPVSKVLKEKGGSVTTIDRGTQNQREIIRNSDVIISGIGDPNHISADMVKDGVIAIDAGFEIDDDGKISGDFSKNIIDKASFYTPVPGGIGPLTVAYIFDNLLFL